MNSYRRATIFVLLFAVLGALMTGYLAYWNYFKPGCSVGPLNWLVTCGGPQKVLIFGQPTCIYGFGMFVLIFITGLVAAVKRPTGPLMGLLVALGLAGTLFAAYILVDEVWFLKLHFTTIPACVYGLVFYLGILLSSVIGRHTLLQELNSLPTTTE